MRLIAYLGPSLRREDLPGVRQLARREGVDLDVRPPIVRGDLLGILKAEPEETRVLMLDGEFGQQLSVSVTEVREYLGTGRYLAGASSMGALRAVECAILGMRAHGWVAARYRDGTIRADDEVALLFDPGDHEPVTLPLANVRWLTQVLVAEGRVDRDTAARLFAVAASMHYRLRVPGAFLRKARQELPESAAHLLAECLRPQALAAWDRKRLDALEALETEIGEAGRGHAG